VTSWPSLLERDPDERIVRWGWVFWLSWLLVGGGLLLGDYRGGVVGIGAVLAAPFWALWLLWLLYRGARPVLRWLRLPAAHGNHYEFDGHPVRIAFDGDEIWFAAADVFEILGSAADHRQAERVRLIVGRDGLREAPSGVLSFSEKGLAAWLDRRSERVAGRFARWVETQVIAPYRRRRALDLQESDES
jgi:hypothetical protein